MEAWITPIVIILGKYALDKGAELGREVGPKALDTAREMFGMVLERIGRTKPETAQEFPADPATYQKPLEKALAEAAAADPAFADRLRALLAEYEAAAREHGAPAGGVRVEVRGSGAAAVGPGAVAAGAGGVAVRGDVSGGIVTGGRGGEDGEPQPV